MSIIASFKPEKISLLNKNTDITVKICSQATFRPAKKNNQVGKSVSMIFLILILQNSVIQMSNVKSKVVLD